MLIVKIEENTGLITFLCPECNREDVIYKDQQKCCYTCGNRYDFYVEKMLQYSSTRRYYHFFYKNHYQKDNS
jgi:transcription elongation factor Elf1